MYISIIKPLILNAQEAELVEYTLLQPLPGLGEKTTGLEYLPTLFQLLIAVTTLLAVIWIVLGGIQYMSTASSSGKAGGKKKVQDALLGLLLAGSSWIILNTINPTIVNTPFGVDSGSPLSPPNTEEVVNSSNDESEVVNSYFANITISKLATNPATGELETNIRTETVYGVTQEACEEEVRKSGGATGGCFPSSDEIPGDYTSYAEKERQEQEELADMKEWEEKYNTTVFEYIEGTDWSEFPINKESWENETSDLSNLESGVYVVITPPDRDEPLVVAGEEIPETITLEGPFESEADCQKHIEYTQVLPNISDRKKNASFSCITL